MAIIKYKDPVTEDYISVKTKTIDTLPVGTEVDFDGNEVPSGWEQVNDPSVYSTTEQRIGTATNGKPLYRKTFIDTTNSTQHADKVIGTIPNLDTIYNIYGGFKTSVGYGGPVPFYYVNKSNNTEYYLVVQKDPSNNIYVVSYYTSASFVVTFEYTKTTD